ncbi:MAG: AraC family transcriptional regulator [Terricaulis sp.]
MNPGENLELLARGGAVGAFLGLALLSVRGRRTPARLTGALFCLGAGAHTLTQLPSSEAALGFVWWPVWSFSVMGAGLFWAFALELFEDGGALDLRRFAPALALLAFGVAALFASEAAHRALYLSHNVLGAGLIAHALFLIARGWRGDLVEARRRLRGPILATASVYALAVIAVQTGELFVGSAQALSPIAAAALLLLGLLSLAAFARMDPSLFGAPAAMPAPAAPQISASPPDHADAQTIAALDRLMREERAYREEGLTIAALALRLKLPEHRLRKLINQHLGHRNFSAYLNQWRIGEAKAALADPTQREVPISTIALDAGFATLGPFNRAFKAETGQTPSEFRDFALPKTP